MRKRLIESKKSFFNPADVLGFLCPSFRQQKIVLDNPCKACYNILMKKRKKNTKRKSRNPVAKFARLFAHARTFVDRTKYSKKIKHKGEEQE